MGDEGWFEESSAGMFKIFIGFVMLMIGGMLLYYSVIGRVASYFADEVSPAIHTVTEAAGSGFSRGTQRGGGIKFDLHSSGQSHVGQASKQREIIKIKCRNCGYLDTEDADFCSKCGHKI
jgi:hypothetical protein